MTPRQLEILQHALGVDQYGRFPKGHDCDFPRNYFCAGEADEPDCRALVELGHMKTFTSTMLPYYNCRVTPAGILAMWEASPKPPKLTRSQQRYRRFLDADTGESFIEWLRYQRT